MKSILITGNLIFIRLDSQDPFNISKEYKYLAGSISGSLFTSGIFTYNEIKTKHPDIKECNSFLEIKDTYNKK